MASFPLPMYIPGGAAARLSDMFGFDLSLMHGPFPAVLAGLAIASMLVGVSGVGRSWWAGRVLPVLGGSLAATVVVNWLLDFHGRFGEIIPFQFVGFAAMPLSAVGLVVGGWRRRRRVLRLFSSLAVPLTLLYAANLVNQYYGYAPTLGALTGAPLDHQITVDQLALRTNDSTVASPAPHDHRTSAGSSTNTPLTHAHGAISRITIPATISHFAARPTLVWVPPAFFNEPRPQLPVIVILAGTPGEPDNMIRAAAADRVADRYAALHDGVAPILIFADGNGSFTADTECVDSNAGHAETYLTKDLPAFVTAAFGTLSGPSHWAIEGYSEGGTCAMDLALGHPDVYGSFVDIAGDLFPNVGSKASTIADLYHGDTAQFEAHDPMLLMHRPTASNVAGWFEVGAHDHKRIAVAATLDAAMRQAGLQSRLVHAPGGHDFHLTTRAVADSFDWISARVGLG